MFCENCWNKLQKSDKFCSSCGQKNTDLEDNNKVHDENILEQKWWLRLIKVIYVILWVPLPIIIITAWNINEPYYSTYGTYWSYEEAFWYALVFWWLYFCLIKCIKLAFLYIALGKKPKWKQEFKKLF